MKIFRHAVSLTICTCIWPQTNCAIGQKKGNTNCNLQDLLLFPCLWKSSRTITTPYCFYFMVSCVINKCILSPNLSTIAVINTIKNLFRGRKVKFIGVNLVVHSVSLRILLRVPKKFGQILGPENKAVSKKNSS